MRTFAGTVALAMGALATGALAALVAWSPAGLLLPQASGAPSGANTAASDGEDAPDFAREIKPLLVRHCYRCHGPQRQESGYRLDQKEAAFRGGDTGEEAIVPGDADNSPLIQYIRGDDPDFVMPPEGQRLTERQVQRVVRWVEQGAAWP